jgi:hypothetical protein
MKDLPVPRRTTPIVPVVAVMKRENSQWYGVKDRSAKDARPKMDEHIAAT